MTQNEEKTFQKKNGKDAYYFSHDCNARNDPKVLALRSVYGAAGYGVYFMLLEILREQPDYQLPVNEFTWKVLSMQMNTPATKVQKIIEDCCTRFTDGEGNTLLRNDGHYLYSLSLWRRMKKMDDISEKRRRARETEQALSEEPLPEEDHKKEAGSHPKQAVREDKPVQKAVKVESKPEQTEIKRGTDIEQTENKTGTSVEQTGNKPITSAEQTENKPGTSAEQMTPVCAGKEKKEKETKEKEKKENYDDKDKGADAPPLLSSSLLSYLKKFHIPVSDTALSALIAFEQAVGTDMCSYAIDIAIDARKPSVSYILGILRNWEHTGIKSLADVEALEKQREQQKQNPQSGFTKPVQLFGNTASTVTAPGDNPNPYAPYLPPKIAEEVLSK